MGGNAISNAIRLEKQYYNHVSEGMETILKQTYPNAKIKTIPSYAEKESFGDLDILISGVDVGTLREFCQQALNAKEIHSNGNVISFGLDITSLLMKEAVFQVDLITVPEEDFDFALNYFSYNDLGNLIGQTAHGIGLKFGHDGLWYKYIIETELVKEICITKDFFVALDILDYSRADFLRGFRSLEDIFHYTVSSEFFTTWNYQLENRNAAGRVRDKKRKTYTAFLEWMKDKNLPSEQKFRNLGLLLSAHRDHGVALQFMYATLDYFRAERVRVKFNGAYVGEWTGLTGKELGSFMAAYRGDDKESFMKKMDSMSGEEIEIEVKQFYETWRKQ
jgi:hypothetical protein